jgi:nonsense-mediated mRNA decay protein 3
MLFKVMSEHICPKCGKGSDEADFIDAFCVDCYPANIKCPNKLRIIQCRSCEKIKIGLEWVSYSRKRISEHVIGKCRGEFSSGEYDSETQLATFIIEKEGSRAKVSRRIMVEIEPAMCRNCSRSSGGYFQGIIQLRGPEKKVGKYADMLYKKLENKTFIAKEEEKHGGLDIYVGNSKAVIALLAELKVNAAITTKLAGVEQGKRLYRTTFLIRL